MTRLLFVLSLLAAPLFAQVVLPPTVEIKEIDPKDLLRLTNAQAELTAATNVIKDKFGESVHSNGLPLPATITGWDTRTVKVEIKGKYAIITTTVICGECFPTNIRPKP